MTETGERVDVWDVEIVAQCADPFPEVCVVLAEWQLLIGDIDSV